MQTKQYTIGMAGHIDHGKTALTQALTGVDTDRLKEEKDRKISIELGYAPLYQDDDMGLSIIDVPGHERFIRQMIAGVSGVDITLLVIAADDGVMPQTIEHLEILHFLNVDNPIIVLTKVDLVDDEWLTLVVSELEEYTRGTVFNHAPIYYVDSVSRTGIDRLYADLMATLADLKPRESTGYFRMPIDQAFHVHGIGTVVRGTIIGGHIHENDRVILQPKNRYIDIKSIQQFGQHVSESSIGHRTALAIKGVGTDEIKRGDVLTSNVNQPSSKRIDIELNISRYIQRPVKQRSPIKLHTGTSEVYGRIVLFDRNEISATTETVYAQLELDDAVYTLRHDLFILRRATPAETIGGGRVIQSATKKHRFGQATVKQLQQEAQQTLEERIIDYLTNDDPFISMEVLCTKLNVNESELVPVLQKLLQQNDIREINNRYVSDQWMERQFANCQTMLSSFHETYPLLNGMDKSTLVDKVEASKSVSKRVVDHWIEKGQFIQHDHVIALPSFRPFIPDQIQPYVDSGLATLEHDGLMVNEWSHYFLQLTDKEMEDLKHFLVERGQVVALNDTMIIDRHVFDRTVTDFKQHHPKSFTLHDAKQFLQLSRKYLIPFLETCDRLRLTEREGDQRYWV
ncbi:selenocysteine-specific elongation factor [Alkalibacillus flavidus]|uniref:Selenocysteine-specific elongation factor n=1 Tax=Alkalibacillus flavidus TaxID=546021 RepID=A0ABV2KRM1_9BACI